MRNLNWNDTRARGILSIGTRYPVGFLIFMAVLIRSRWRILIVFAETNSKTSSGLAWRINLPMK